MPWETVWRPPRVDDTLAVWPGDHHHPPDGYILDGLVIGPLTAHRSSPYGCVYLCCQCGGWIEGHADEYQVNDLGPLSGRRGTEFYCRRCGAEVGFFGMMA